MGEHAAPAPIRALPEILANQIAAGEVVERPASVVKELVENALDADATKIDIELESGGTRLIRVRDDGFGISSEDLVLALSRHATSKIATLDDLDRIASMGFRGEALPSIASVSRLVLSSRPRNAEGGARVRVEGGGVGSVEPAASTVGTTVEVRDLFFNVPARRRFLRTPRTEFRHVEDAVRRLALSRPDVSFTLHHDARRVLEVTQRMEPARRMSRMVGEDFVTSALEIAFEAGDLSLRGFLAPPSAARGRSDRQYLFVNGRSVRDDVVRHAVRVGFGDTLAGAQYPAFVLHLGIDPATVDVNVHPTKHEVRFREPRHVHDFVRHAVSRALGGLTAATAPETVPMALEAGPGAPGAGNRGVEAEPPPMADAARGAYPASGIRSGEGRVREHLAAYSALSAGAPAAGDGTARGRVRLGDHVLVENDAKLLVIDLRAGRRALVRERLDESTRMAAPVSRPLLIPHTQGVHEGVANAVDESSASFQSLGVEIRRGAPDSITLRAVPACLAGVAPDELLDVAVDWARASREVTHLVDSLAALAASRPFDGDVDDIVDAAIGGRLGAGVAAVDEAMLRRLFD